MSLEDVSELPFQQDFLNFLNSNSKNIALSEISDLFHEVRYDFLAALYNSDPEVRKNSTERIKNTYGGILSFAQPGDGYIMIRVKTKKIDIILPLCEIPKKYQEQDIILDYFSEIPVTSSPKESFEEEMQEDQNYWANFRN